jgi:hypothetical protein
MATLTYERCCFLSFPLVHLSVRVKANSHMPCRAHAVPLPRRAAPLPFSDRPVSFVKVRVVAGNIQTASPTV